MKITVILQQDGNVVGTARHSDTAADVHTALRPRPGHTLHEIDVSDDYKSLTADELHERIRTIHLRRQ
jgi:hypothetical protein